MRAQENSFKHLDRVILGTAGLGGVWGKIVPEASVQAILEALQKGISAIDTAPAYGDAEVLVGRALRCWDGPLPQISTKVGRLKSYAADVCFYDYSADGLKKSVENSLSVLGVPAIDVLFLHEPGAVPVDESERIIGTLVEFKRKGYAKKIGLGGNSPKWFGQYIEAGLFDVVMEHNRLDTCCLDALNTSLPSCRFVGAEFWAASPLHSGLLGNRFEYYTKSIPAWLLERDVERAKGVKEIADNYGIPLATLAHRFLLSIPQSFRMVIGASNPPELQNTLSDLHRGPLSVDLYTEIVNHII
jgi:aryl-alcohol dehydrogenase-like predicted oxidoreductase